MTAQVSACNNSVTLSITFTKTAVWVKAVALAKRVLFWPGRVITTRPGSPQARKNTAMPPQLSLPSTKFDVA